MAQKSLKKQEKGLYKMIAKEKAPKHSSECESRSSSGSEVHLSDSSSNKQHSTQTIETMSKYKAKTTISKTLVEVVTTINLPI